MGSGMMVPVPFVLWMLAVAFFMLCLLLAIKLIAGGWRGWPAVMRLPRTAYLVHAGLAVGVSGHSEVISGRTTCPRLPRPAERRLGSKLSLSGADEALHTHSRLPVEEEPEQLVGAAGAWGPEVELSGLPLKTYATHNGHNA
jgi:hypothetical protein